jgi:hypothetical protein
MEESPCRRKNWAKEHKYSAYQSTLDARRSMKSMPIGKRKSTVDSNYHQSGPNEHREPPLENKSPVANNIRYPDLIWFVSDPRAQLFHPDGMHFNLSGAQAPCDRIIFSELKGCMSTRPCMLDALHQVNPLDSNSRQHYFHKEIP